jgi:aminoglycoside phosphotransferase (APT) family kinase protein
VIEITADLVRRLVGEQFPGWRQLAVTPGDRQGNDNRTFRLGDRLVVRLPSAEWYADDVQRSFGELARVVDVAACRTVWADALVSAWPAGPVWFHGDVATGNLLTVGGRLAAVIDFGTCGVGDPACDLVMAWTYFAGPERKAFRAAAGLADDVWRRARGWALWKALLVAAGRPAVSSGGDPAPPEIAEIEAILADPVV